MKRNQLGLTAVEMKMLPKAAQRELARMRIKAPVEEHKVFVYGTLIAGERNARWAGNARRQKAWTVGTIYDTGCGFPAFVKRGDTHVKGEVLTVDDAGFRSMDRLEGYPRLYRREQIQVHLVGGGNVLAWVYIMNNLRKDAPVIESGDWVAYRKAGYRNAEEAGE